MTGRNEHKQQLEVALKEKVKQYPDNYYLDAYRNYLFAAGLSHFTQREYINRVIKFLEAMNKPVQNITGLDVFTYIGGLNNQNGDVTSEYKINVYSALLRYFKCLIGCKIITKADNPMDDEIVEKPKARDNPNPRQKDILTVREMNTVRKRVREGFGNDRAMARQERWHERDIAIIDLFLSTGMRCSALTEIDVSDYNSETGIITVVNKGFKVMEYELAPSVIDSINDWLRIRSYLLFDAEEVTNAMFISNRLQRISQRGVSYLIQKYTDGINGKHITPHRLRATFATMMYNDTKDLLYVSRCMGHSSPQTTQKHYIKSEENPTRSAGARIANKW